MGSKRPPPLDDPPSASSDEEDETEDEQETIVDQKTQQSSESEEEEEESEEESEEEQTPLRVIKPQIQNPNIKSESEDDDEEEEEEESEEEETQIQTPTPVSSSIFEFKPDIKSPSVSNFAIKPSKKITTPEKKPALKPPPDLNNKKKAKVSNADENKSSSIIKRVWSEEDELMLLQGFIDYQSKNGCSPLSDMDGFYQFTMDSLPGNASKSQLYEKVRRLKKKFRVNQEKVTATGQDPVFVKPHERTLFEVSKKIWGINGCETVGNVNGSSVKPKARSVKPKPKPKANVKVEKVEEVVDEEMMLVQVKDFETLYPYWNAGLNLLGASSSLNFPTGIVGLFRENLRSIEEAKATEMNEKWKEHFENEAVLQKRKKELLSKVTTQ